MEQQSDIYFRIADTSNSIADITKWLEIPEIVYRYQSYLQISEIE